MLAAVDLTVVGSINLDLVARVEPRRVGGGVVSLLAGREPGDALTRVCAAGAIAAARFGAQPSLPAADEVDAILRA